MQIIWYGASCFKLISSETTILTDPFLPAKLGFKNPRITSEVVIFSSPEEKKDLSSESFIVSTPGEIEIKNIFIYGIPHFEKNVLKTIYKINAEDLKICFLGEISESLNEEELDKLSEIDILLLPAPGSTPSLKKAKDLINEIEPAVIVFTYQKNKNEISELIKEIGFKNIEEEDKLKIRKKDLFEGKRKMVILKPGC